MLLAFSQEALSGRSRVMTDPEGSWRDSMKREGEVQDVKSATQEEIRIAQQSCPLGISKMNNERRAAPRLRGLTRIRQEELTGREFCYHLQC